MNHKRDYNRKDHKYFLNNPDDLDYGDTYSILWVFWYVICIPLLFIISLICIALTPFWLNQIQATEDVKTAIIILAVLICIFIFFLVYRWVKSWKE